MIEKFIAIAIASAFVSAPVFALDPPHAYDCGWCHMTHNSPGDAMTAIGDNFNLCASCHAPGGFAGGKAYVNADAAEAWPGIATNILRSGTSHRWDSGVAGYVIYAGGAALASSGTVSSAGVFTGSYAKTYSVRIVTGGNTGAARFNWSATSPGGGGTNVLTATNVVLNEGVSAVFNNATNGVSYQSNDTWQIFVRNDLRSPTNVYLLAHMSNGVMSCSVCHDVHSETNRPFDTNAPAYLGPGTGAGRHFMQVDNDDGQMCADCHITRQVTNSVFGSHPVGILATTGTYYQVPSSLFPRSGTTGKIQCQTCHQVHNSATTDGSLLRMTNDLLLCISCHTLADTGSAHFASANLATIWPGGQYGSLFPSRTNSSKAGTCDGCHFAHGWPDAANPTNHYPKLTVDNEENLCYTCHDVDGPSNKNVKDDFAKAYRHPVLDSDALRQTGRTVECTDCHNMHTAQIGSHTNSATATAARNAISNPLRGVSGVVIDFTGLGNFVAPAR